MNPSEKILFICATPLESTALGLDGSLKRILSRPFGQWEVVVDNGC
ncbi:MAG: hypothetical protein IPK10_18435 [Bacteroidetes bacterium]|nr:hypothetical protein [Bacteroidota bacterium]